MTTNSLEVMYHNKKIGTLVYKDYLTSFQYDKQWINEGFSISPFALPLTDKIYTPKIQPFDGLFGIFNDSLPDGWGRLLVDRMIKKKSINMKNINPLYRLSIIGNSAMGALEYSPKENLTLDKIKSLSLDSIKEQCNKLLANEEIKDLDYLFKNGGSSGGARPKILKKINNEDWIIKFPSSLDPKDIGLQEYLYSKCAKKCGIEVPEIKLLESKICLGYFGIKRFDRKQNNKIHMASASAILETSHRLPNLDYIDLMKLTYILTKDENQVKQMYKLMCFNVFSHNRDDHSKNFSFLYTNKWTLSPAYDLTYSNSFNGEHATTIAGEGLNPTKKDLLRVGSTFGLSINFCKDTIDKIETIVNTDLNNYINKT